MIYPLPRHLLKAAQVVLDHVGFNLLHQGRRSTDDLGLKCRYRGVGGTKCAVGFLIPDDQYDPKFETISFWNLLKKKDLPFIQELTQFKGTRFPARELDTFADFLTQLMAIHDGDPPETWRLELIQLAERYGLDDTEVRGCPDNTRLRIKEVGHGSSRPAEG